MEKIQIVKLTKEDVQMLIERKYNIKITKLSLHARGVNGEFK